jgi:hypothetical protein
MRRPQSNGRIFSRSYRSRAGLVVALAIASLLAFFSPVNASETGDSHLTIWGIDALQPPLDGGDVTATARLVDFRAATRGAPLPGRTVTFSFVDETVDVVTDQNGEAQATFTYAPSQTDIISASFAGDGAFQPSMDRAWLRGDILVAVGDGMAHRYDASGQFINVFDSTTGSPDSVGMCFDSAHNLYIVSFQAQVISKFNRSTGEVVPDWASGFQVSPESCTQGEEDLDGDGKLDDVIYAGEQDGLNLIRKFDTGGNLLDTFSVDVSGRGSDWLDMSASGTTIRYTSEGDEIFEYDVLNAVQLPPFVLDQSVPANQSALRPDSLPENLIDGAADTSWITNDGDVSNQSVVIDLAGATQTIDRIFIEGHDQPTAVKSFLVQLSASGLSEASFSTVLVGVSPRSTAGQSFTFPAVNAHYVRLVAIDNYGNPNNLRVDRFQVFNSAGVNVASLESGASIAAYTSAQRDPLLVAPCFALRTLPDRSLLVACDDEVVHVATDGKTPLHRYSRQSMGMKKTDTIFGLSLATDVESFWAASQIEGRVVNVDLDTGEVLRTVLPVKRGPRVGGVLIYGEPMEGVNYEPVAYSQWVTTFSGSPLAIKLTGDDFESEQLAFTVTNQPNNGSITGVAPDLVYTSATGFVGDDIFTFFVSDGVHNSLPATINIEVQEPNDMPIAAPGGPYETPEGGSISLDGSASYDPDGEIAVIEWDLDGDGVFGETGAAGIYGSEDGAAVIFSAGSLDGPSVFPASLRVTDNRGAEVTAQVDIAITNEPPSVTASGGVVRLGEMSKVKVAFTDPGAPDTHTALVDWGDGSSSQSAGAIFSPHDFTHLYHQTGQYNVTVTVTDDDGGSAQAQAVASVGEIYNARPVAVSKSVVLAQDSSLQISLAGSDDDLGPDQGLAFTIVAPPIYGELTELFQSGPTSALVIYTPPEGFLGSDNFVFTVSDGIHTSAPGIVTITVIDPNASGGGGGGFFGGDEGTSGGSSGPPQNATVPSQLSAVSLEPGDESITIRWSPPAFDGGSPVLGYRVLNLVTGRVQLIPAPATFGKIFNLENGLDYSFQAQAFNSVGVGPSVVVGPVTPRGAASPPLDVTAQLGADRSVTVTWSPPESDGGSDIIEYIVEVVDGGEVARVNASDASAASVANLLPGFSYSFTVAAVTGAGPGDPSDPTEPLFIPGLANAPVEPSPAATLLPATPPRPQPTATPPPAAPTATATATPVLTLATATTSPTLAPAPQPQPTVAVAAPGESGGGSALKLIITILVALAAGGLIFGAATGRLSGFGIGGR